MLHRLLSIALLLLPLIAAAEPTAKKDAVETLAHTEDVIYARKQGVSLTLDVFAPKEKSVGRGVILCVSGGWVSDKNMLAVYRPVFVPPLVARGYTVFAVIHRSQPFFTNLDAAEDIDASVQFVKKYAKKYGVDPEKLAAAGMSAGGHLALLQGTATGVGRVAAVGCFCPPTDFLNFGKSGVSITGDLFRPVAPAFDYRKLELTKNLYVPVSAEERIALIKKVSPVYRVSKSSAPTLIFHGDADWLVPIQQSELIMAKYKEAEIPFELVVRKRHGHGWTKMADDVRLMADWFDKHLGVSR